MTEKLNEKMTNNSEPITAVIIRANSEIGKPIMGILKENEEN